MQNSVIVNWYNAQGFPTSDRLDLAIESIEQLGFGLKEIDRDIEFAEERFQRAVAEQQFAQAHFYDEHIKVIRGRKSEIQAPIDLIATDSAWIIDETTKNEAQYNLARALELTRLSLIGPEAKGALQDATLKLAATLDPSMAFSVAAEIAETTTGMRQVAAIDTMFTALKADEKTEAGNAAKLLQSIQLPWGVPRENAVLQNFIDLQLTSLRAGTGLIEYSERDTRSVRAAVTTLQTENGTPVLGAANPGNTPGN